MLNGHSTVNRIVIVGPGAMGLLHAAYMAAAGQDVTLLDYRADRAQRLSREGLIVERGEGPMQVRVPCRAQADFGSVDLIFVFVKAYSTAQAIGHASPLIGPDTVVVSLQNGLGNVEKLLEYQAPHLVLGGTSSSGATLLGEGHVQENGLGQIQVASPAGDIVLTAQLATWLESVGLAAEVSDDLNGLLWRKAVINCAINPLTALTGLRNGQLLDISPLRSLLRAVATEALDVARGLKIRVPKVEMPGLVEDICRQTANNRSSMLQDLTAGRRTEIAEISGAIVAAAEAAGLSAPLNATLAALVLGAQHRAHRPG